MKVKNIKCYIDNIKKAKNYKLVDLLDADVETFTSDKGIVRRRKIAKVLKNRL